MPLWDETGWIPAPQRAAAVLWISFLTAGVATGAFFSALDPLELERCVGFPAIGRTAAYTIGFLLLWLVAAGSALLAVFFVYPRAPDRASASPPASPSGMDATPP
jgi:hypothetical protein